MLRSHNRAEATLTRGVLGFALNDTVSHKVLSRWADADDLAVLGMIILEVSLGRKGVPSPDIAGVTEVNGIVEN